MIQGKVPELVLKRSVLKNITADKTIAKKPASGLDASVVSGICDDNIIIKSSGAVDYAKKLEVPCTFYRCFNSMLCERAVPKALEITVLLPEDAKEKQIKKIISEYDEICRNHGMVISGGHMQVTDKVNEPVVTLTMIGKQVCDVSSLKGEKITLIMTKSCGIEGTAVIASELEERLRTRFNENFYESCAELKNYLSVEEEAMALIDNKNAVLHDMSSGGVYAAIWEMAEYLNKGAKVNLKDINILQETVEVSELFDINPYKLTSQGSLLIATDDVSGVTVALEEKNIPYSIIGELNDTNDRVAVMDEDEKRFLELPRGDEIYKVIKERLKSESYREGMYERRNS